MADIFNMLDTWNASGTVFTGIKLNVTDTASAAGSLLMDLQVGGSSLFSVTKAGRTNVADINCPGGDLLIYRNGSVAARFGTGRFAVGVEFGISNNNPNAPDVFLARDAANTLAQRNGVNAQAFNLYNTYTDASNYERGVMKWDANTLRIGVEAAGTGTNRTIEFRNTGTRFVRVPTAGGIQFFNGANRELYLQWDAVGVRSDAAFLWSSSTAIGEGAGDTGFVRAAANIVRVTNGSTGGGAMQLTEMTAPAAPATNNVRIYAEDDGTGKTRLMALFPTGAAQQIAIEP